MRCFLIALENKSAVCLLCCFKYFELNNPFNLFFSKEKVKSLENEINEIIQQNKCHQYGYPQLETFPDTRNFGKPWYK